MYNLDGDDAIGMFYEPDINRFVDEDGLVIHNPFEIITPNEMVAFKAHREYRLSYHRRYPEVYVEMFWPDDAE